MKLAEQIFDLYTKLVVLEGDLYDIICAWPGVRGEPEIGHDFYDGSISLRGMPKDFVLTDEQMNQLQELGFKSCWLGDKFVSLVPLK